MSYTLADDLAFILEDAPGSKAVVYGAQSTDGLLFATNADLFGEARVRGVSRVLVIRAGTLTGLVVDGSITVGGTAYRIAEPAFPIGGDEAMTAVPLKGG